MTKTNWQVVYTKPRHELKVTHLLSRKNIVNYCPLHIREVLPGDSKKPVAEPLFPSCIFVNLREEDQASLLNTPGVISFVYWRNAPVVVSESEINAIVLTLKDYAHVMLDKYPLGEGDAGLEPEHELTEKARLFDPAITIDLPSLGYRILAKTPQEATVLSASLYAMLVNYLFFKTGPAS